MQLSFSMPHMLEIKAMMQPWETAVSGAEQTKLAKWAEKLGYAMICVPEHHVISNNHVDLSGKFYFHAYAGMAYFAGATETIRVNSCISILPLQNPVVSAKALSTIDWFSGGRCTITFAAGWLKEEFDALGVPAVALAVTLTAIRLMSEMVKDSESDPGRKSIYLKISDASNELVQKMNEIALYLKADLEVSMPPAPDSAWRHQPVFLNLGNVVDRQDVRPCRIRKTDIFETDIAARRLRQGCRLRRRRDLRFDPQDLEQALGGAGRSRDFAPDFAELAEAGGCERRIQHELAEPARRDLPGQHVVGADPEDRHDAGEHDEDDDQGEQRARPRRVARRLIGLLDLAAETGRRHLLAGIGLHGPDRTDQFGGVGAGVRQRILRVARQPPHPASERHQRNHDHRDRQQIGRAHV